MQLYAEVKAGMLFDQIDTEADVFHIGKVEKILGLDIDRFVALEIEKIVEGGVFGYDEFDFIVSFLQKLRPLFGTVGDPIRLGDILEAVAVALDADIVSVFLKKADKWIERVEGGFSTGQHDETGRVGGDLIKDLFRRHETEGTGMEGVVAKRTGEIAAVETDENRRSSRVASFSLDGVENGGDFQLHEPPLFSGKLSIKEEMESVKKL